MPRKLLLQARKALAVRVSRDERIRVINTHGSQVVDTWAYDLEDAPAFMSMEHTRVHAAHPTPVNGTVFLTNHRRPVLEMTADTSPGIHDWFFAACDRYRYELLGFKGVHDNCSDNLRAVLVEEGLEAHTVPCPLNLFENVPLVAGGSMAIEPPAGKAGDYVELTARTNALVAFSACPQDMAPTNGADMMPKDVELEIYPT